ncbi:protein-disulfide reductase DsbD domain-containing protein [Siphonobacter curvatus]|uniref:Thiol:disulfide interchange protein DsbD N-terminal domain-containing protein n=1 Tax=Siphonobacter curvatus TaxID=2094562 RepID=A0A2S7IG20_9BACT|nr:protein-disulfide reductase DsbD domain-containing protein [Siphonobacter curvatus]PQA54456.1 hypothetical protein C5O19_22160 [Siphonobacter curvatus]
MKKVWTGLALFLASVTLLWAQENKQITWEYHLSKTALQPGDEVDLILTAKVEKGWLLYSSDFVADVGPQPTAFEFVSNGTFSPVGPVVPVDPLTKKDKTWDLDVSYFTKRAEFRQKVRIDKLDYFFTGYITGQVCHEKKGLCVPFRQAFNFDPRNAQ